MVGLWYTVPYFLRVILVFVSPLLGTLDTKKLRNKYQDNTEQTPDWGEYSKNIVSFLKKSLLL